MLWCYQRHWEVNAGRVAALWSDVGVWYFQPLAVLLRRTAQYTHPDKAAPLAQDEVLGQRQLAL